MLAQKLNLLESSWKYMYGNLLDIVFPRFPYNQHEKTIPTRTMPEGRKF